MKILWVKIDFLHPTNRGGQIRTLETLKRLHENNEIHYVAYDNPEQPEGVARSGEYCTRAYPIDRPVPPRNSPAFFSQLGRNLFSELPLAVGRYKSAEMRNAVGALVQEGKFDSVVCDFLSAAPNIPCISRSVLFQHNVETMIWRRHAEHAPDPLRRAYFHSQAERMYRIERRVCREASQVIAVSHNDASQMRQLFGVERVAEITTGVDLNYFRRPEPTNIKHDLVFIGAMDWRANIDGARYFITEVLPLIRRTYPVCSLVLAGRSPVPEIRAFAEKDPLITVTGTVPDIRPYIWESRVSIVPLRIGGGTRLKIYEAMAAEVPVVSSPVGAEGLAVTDGLDISLGDDAATFADRCVALLDNTKLARAQSAAALKLVSSRFSWERVAESFEQILKRTLCAV